MLDLSSTHMHKKKMELPIKYQLGLRLIREAKEDQRKGGQFLLIVVNNLEGGLIYINCCS